jgi:hypothetical protein
MKNHNFIVGVVDTDSTSYCKPDMSPFSKEEIDSLIAEINSISPEFMVWENDGYYDTCIIIRAKNYVLRENGTGKVTFKGSATKDQKKELVLQEFLKEMLINILDNDLNYENLRGIYQKYLREIDNIQDIKKWSQKKTITAKILKCAGHQEMTKEEKKEAEIRKNETNVWDAIANETVQEGDKVYLYPVSYEEIESGRIGKNGKPLKDKIVKHNSLRLIKNWTGQDHDKNKLRERLEATLKILSNILDVNQVLY